MYEINVLLTLFLQIEVSLTVRKILKKHGVFSTIEAKKITIKNNSANFRNKMVHCNDEKRRRVLVFRGVYRRNSCKAH